MKFYYRLQIVLVAAALLLATRPRPSAARTNQLPVAVRQSDSDGYGGAGYTILPLLDEEPCTAIIIHGLGGNGEEWGFMSLGLSIFSLNFVKFIIPTADSRRVEYLDQRVPSWFDISELDGANTRFDEGQLQGSVNRINRIIDGEIQAGVRPDRIFLVGFSQGGALALTTFLRSQRGLGGCVGVATFLPAFQDYSDGTVTVSSAIRQKDVLMMHGTEDEVVALEFGERSLNEIDKHVRNATFLRIENQGHVILSEEVVSNIEFFIRDRASGTTRYLKNLVADLTESFGGLSARVRLSGLL